MKRELHLQPRSVSLLVLDDEATVMTSGDDVLGDDELLLHDRGWKQSTVVLDAHDDPIAASLRAHPDPAAITGVADAIGDRPPGVNDEMQEGEVELSRATWEQWQLTEIEVEIGHVLVLAAGGAHDRLEPTVHVGRTDLGRTGRVELGQRPQGPNDFVDALHAAFEGLRHVTAKVLQVDVRLGLPQDVVLRRRSADFEDTPVLLDELEHVTEGVVDEVQAVRELLHGAMKLTRQAWCELSQQLGLTFDSILLPRHVTSRTWLVSIAPAPLIGVRGDVLEDSSRFT